MIWHDGCGPRLVRYDTVDGDSDADTNLWLVLDQTQKGRVTRAELRQARASLARRYLHRCRIARSNTTTPLPAFNYKALLIASSNGYINQWKNSALTVCHTYDKRICYSKRAVYYVDKPPDQPRCKAPLLLLPQWATEHSHENRYTIPLIAHTFLHIIDISSLKYIRL